MASSSMQHVVAANKSILTPVMTLEGHKRINHTLRNGEPDLFAQVDLISYFPDGKQMISKGRDKTIRRWDLREGKEIEEVRVVCEQMVYRIEVSRDGRWVVTVGGNYTEAEKLKVCEVETGIVRIFQSHSKLQRIHFIDISPDSTLLADGSEDYGLGGSSGSTTRIWSLDTGKLVAGPFKMDYRMGSVRFSRDSKKLAVMSHVAKYLEVWDVQTQKLVVSVGNSSDVNFYTYLPVFWTMQDKTIVAAFNFKNSEDILSGPDTIYEFDASTLEIVGAPFKGHTYIITGLALSFDCALLASTAYDHTIKLWAFQSRQLLASFDVQSLNNLIFSPNSYQLAYTTWDDTKIYIYDIPLDILARIGPTAQEKPSTSASKIPDLLNSDATRRAVRRNPAIPRVISCPPRPPPTRDLQQHAFFRYFHNLLPSPTNVDQPHAFVDFPVTLPLPRNLSPSAQVMDQGPSHTDPRQNSRSMSPLSTTQPGQSLTTALVTFTAHLNRLSTWWPVRAGHASPPNVDVPFAWGNLRHAAADDPSNINDGLIRDEDYVPPSPPPNPNSQPLPTGGNSTGEHGSGRLCGCF